MLDVKKLLTKICGDLLDIGNDIAVNSKVREGVTVYTQGTFRQVHLDSPSAWCATLSVEDRPAAPVRSPGKVFNGSTYVDCVTTISTDGTVKVTDLYGGTISGAQYGYLIPRDLYYYVP